MTTKIRLKYNKNMLTGLLAGMQLPSQFTVPDQEHADRYINEWPMTSTPDNPTFDLSDNKYWISDITTESIYD